jgi:hypothetical protein
MTDQIIYFNIAVLMRLTVPLKRWRLWSGIHLSSDAEIT